MKSSTPFLRDFESSRYPLGTPRPTQFVYLLCDGQFVKVGRASNTLKRIKLLQTGNPRKINPVVEFGHLWPREASDFERDLHRLMKKSKSHGEWFSCSVDEALAAFTIRLHCFFASGAGFRVFGNGYEKAVFDAFSTERKCRDRTDSDHHIALERSQELLRCFD